jgi:hypothetical protein
MAPKNPITISPNFFSQLVFGLFLTLIFGMTGIKTPWNIFLGILGGLLLGGVSNASRNSPQAPTLASSDGIDAGLKYWLFFLFGFVFLGYQGPLSILLSGIAGFGGGWIIAWWGSREETITQLQLDTLEDSEGEVTSVRSTKQQVRRATRRFRKASGLPNFKFWERR